MTTAIHLKVADDRRVEKEPAQRKEERQ